MKMKSNKNKISSNRNHKKYWTSVPKIKERREKVKESPRSSFIRLFNFYKKKIILSK